MMIKKASWLLWINLLCQTVYATDSVVNQDTDANGTCSYDMVQSSKGIQTVLNAIILAVHDKQLDTSIHPDATTQIDFPLLTMIPSGVDSDSIISQVSFNPTLGILAVQFSSASVAGSGKQGCGPLNNTIWLAQIKVVPLLDEQNQPTVGYWYFNPEADRQHDLRPSDVRSTFGRGYTTPVSFDYVFITNYSPVDHLLPNMIYYATFDQPWFSSATTYGPDVLTSSLNGHMVGYDALMNSNNGFFVNNDGIPAYFASFGG